LLSFELEESCTFVREATRKVEAPTSYVREEESGGRKEVTTHKIVTTVHEWFWRYAAAWRIVLRAHAQSIVLTQRDAACELITNSERTPHPEKYSSFRFVSFRFVSFRFVSFRFVSFRFVSFRFVSFVDSKANARPHRGRVVVCASRCVRHRSHA
jgi:hypothetical protein